MIKYFDTAEGIKPENLEGFFVNWPKYPSLEKHLEILQNSEYVVLAVEGETSRVIGFINAISDKVLSAYIPLLEVLPAYQGKGIGEELVRRMLAKLDGYYMVDLCCDENMIKFYEKFGMKKFLAMVIRNFSKQDGK